MKRQLSDGRYVEGIEPPEGEVPVIQYEEYIFAHRKVNLGTAKVIYNKKNRRFYATTDVHVPEPYALFLDIEGHELEVEDGVAYIRNGTVIGLVVDELPTNYYKDSDV